MWTSVINKLSKTVATLLRDVFVFLLFRTYYRVCALSDWRHEIKEQRILLVSFPVAHILGSEVVEVDYCSWVDELMAVSRN
jgi:hypothetical protein